jgi:hypothetical protein
VFGETPARAAAKMQQHREFKNNVGAEATYERVVEKKSRN